MKRLMALKITNIMQENKNKVDKVAQTVLKALNQYKCLQGGIKDLVWIDDGKWVDDTNAYYLTLLTTYDFPDDLDKVFDLSKLNNQFITRINSCSTEDVEVQVQADFSQNNIVVIDVMLHNK